MKLELFPRAQTDIIRQFRYYLVNCDAPEIARRFQTAVEETAHFLVTNPKVGRRVAGSVPGLRSWPVRHFRVIRVYYQEVSEKDERLQIVRILHGKQNLRRLLGRERFFQDCD